MLKRNKQKLKSVLNDVLNTVLNTLIYKWCIKLQLRQYSICIKESIKYSNIK